MSARALQLLERRAGATPGRSRLQQPSATLAPAQLQELAAEALAEGLEAAMRQPLSPAPAFSHYERLNSRLAQLLSAAAAAVAVSTAAAAANRGAGRAIPPCWLPAGGLASKLQLALQQCGNLLAEACKRLDGLAAAEEQGLRALVDALHEYQSSMGSVELTDSLLG